MVIVGLTQRRRIVLALLLAVCFSLSSGVVAAPHLRLAPQDRADTLPQLLAPSAALDPALADGTRQRPTNGVDDPPKAASLSRPGWRNSLEDTPFYHSHDAEVASTLEPGLFLIRAPPCHLLN